MTIGNFIIGSSKTIYDEMAEIQKEINAIDFQKKELTEKLDELKMKAAIEMQANGEKTHRTAQATFTIKDSYIRHDFDKARFQQDNAELFNQYLKDTEVKGGMSIKIIG
jgi:hypothetical protein